ncbi:MAG: ATP synthase F0 subunit B [Acutalibacteraceae bacterium]
MTIQLSISVWTIICFVLLMIILDKLLFKPVLKVMDERKERIKRAADRKAEYEEKQKEYDALILEKKKQAQQEQSLKIKKKIESIRTESKEAVEEANQRRIRTVDEYRLKTDEEQCLILKDLSAHATEIAKLFADSLVKE